MDMGNMLQQRQEDECVWPYCPSSPGESTGVPSRLPGLATEVGDTTTTTDDNGSGPGPSSKPPPAQVSTALTTATHAAPTIHPSENTVVVLSSTQAGNAAATAAPSQAASTSGGLGSVSGGAVVGIAIGTALAGAAIAFVAAFLVFRRRNRNTRLAATSYGSTPDLITLAKGGQTNYVSVSQAPVPAPIVAPTPRQHQALDPAASSFLPPAADDHSVAARVSALFSAVHQHVDSFYRDVHASITPSMESDLARFGASGGMAELLRTASSPTVAIKHALVDFVLDLGGDAFVPAEVKGLKEEAFVDSSDLTAPYLLYRRLAVHLYLCQTPSHPASTLSSIREAAEHFALTFFPWANPSISDHEKDEDLVHLITSALDLSLWLRGQPFLYEFVWEEVGRRGIVVKPGFARWVEGSESGRKMLLEGSVEGI
ncbi:hypothetical protein BDV95DRAFT_612711 [Massariosphaeria phaeospora]|uniref:Uncharacterized protein n=1 Tax=Massariosphaeria phaeospora TaxID=100035 RepID=A0A7C8HYP8_9PLEO|nr:hypothetical protein BDV95DRAFT_612711 [Massariosphaeria phaeospora]